MKLCVSCMCYWLACFPFRGTEQSTLTNVAEAMRLKLVCLRLLIWSDAHGQIVNDTLSVNDVNDTNGSLAETVSTTTLARSACHVACDGLSALQATMTDLKTRDAEGEDVTLLDQCMAVQRHVEAVQCLLQGPGKVEDSCISVSTSLEVLKANCVMVGRDILTPLVESTYPATRCTLCEVASGQIRHVSVPEGLLQCELLCSQDVGCRGFDFDTLRSFCRTWSSCPSRSNTYGCQWTVYDRPAWQYQTFAPSTTQEATNNTEPIDTKRQAIAVSAALLHRIHVAPFALWHGVLLALLGTLSS